MTIYNTHEAIVTQELWDKCREMEASVSQGKKNKTGYVNPLSGLVYCADCGTADIYSHLDANAKSEAGRAIESVLSINTEDTE